MADRVSRAIFEPEHEAFRESVGTFLDKEVVPFHDQWETRRRRRPRGLGEGRRAGPARAPDRGGVRRRRDHRLPLQRRDRRGDDQARRLRRRVPALQRHDRAVPRGERHGRAAAALVPRALCSGETIAAIAMTEPGAGSDLQGIRTTRGRRRRPLRPQRAEDLHLQRHPRRPGGRGGAHRPRRGAPGHLPAGRRARAWRASSAAATWRRSASTPRTPPSCSSATCACRRRTCSARRVQGFVALMTNLPQERLSIAVTAAMACEVGRRGDADVREGPHGVRPTDRQVPAQPLRDRRDGDRGAHRPRLRRRLPGQARRAASSTP